MAIETNRDFPWQTVRHYQRVDQTSKKHVSPGNVPSLWEHILSDGRGLPVPGASEAGGWCSTPQKQAKKKIEEHLR